jgi:RNA polymerase sigma factor (sigma-70 family)
MSSDRQKLVSTARRLLGTRADAEDAVQDTYMRALTALSRGAAPEPAWMYTALRNLAIDRLRRQRLELEHSQIESPPEPSSEDLLQIRSECQAALRQLLSRVGHIEAAALLLRDVFEFDYDELAYLLGKKEPACRQLLSRARTRTQHAAAEIEPDEDHLARCWYAVENRDPTPLIRLLESHTPTACVSASAAPRSATRLVLINGRYAMALVLDGVVLCVVPIGTRPEVAREFC